MDDLARAQWIALSLVPAIGGKLFARLILTFGSPGAVLTAQAAELQTVPGVGPRIAAAIGAVDQDQVYQQMLVWQAAGITILRLSDAGYPPLLAALDDAPPTLFVRGALTPADTRAAALVGTRQPTATSRELAYTLAGQLAAHGWTVISGLALGTDTAAHRGALAAGGRTLAVLGCGVQTIYPPENTLLAGQIVQHGALLSEVHPASSPGSPALVARNRLISGLSRAVIVIETGENGGSLHAVRFARAQQRPVFAVQNDSAGNQLLIAAGALALPPDHAWEQLAPHLR
jgi:DNA processing protein